MSFLMEEELPIEQEEARKSTALTRRRMASKRENFKVLNTQSLFLSCYHDASFESKVLPPFGLS
jgi:hypothetical protein